MEQKLLVKIIIPVYKTDLNEFEKLALLRCFSVFEKFPIIFIKPKHLNLSIFNKMFGNRFSEESFPDDYFTSIKGYNRLMLSKEFYERFLDSKYILIYQTDAYVFEDKLEMWCSKGYDYIGAPWLPKSKYLKWPLYIFLQIKRYITLKTQEFNSPIRLIYSVGNGGFSLRNTEKFHAIIQQMSNTAKFYVDHCDKSIYNEDVFWGLEVNRREKKLNIPPYKEALAFAFEENPETAFILNKKQLPFGTHAWYKSKQLNFWKKYIQTEHK